MQNNPFAREMRSDPTPAEREFWTLLLPFRENGWHIRRQAPIGSFVVDFVCKRIGVIFEIDGETHYIDGAAEKDAARTAYLASRGYRVVRFTNDEVLRESDGVYWELMDLFGDPAEGWAVPENWQK
ncbi:MAG: DUF559 domain-containing protein [Candidatus Devosia phytovorans]|uniref:DUF559 domain-containing protein n=1 Tax=Candidatus Devosia phytovorans TaxID=3121372 RepID=A0AAJ5VWE4_9HYPH|nr:DUF559 domain-containing protein [Devosia sp.]WEK05652.1 MAG: DUF559 domain-containing protein [Devosia sp.]